MTSRRWSRGSRAGLLSIGAVVLVLSAAACADSGQDQESDQAARPTNGRPVAIGDVATIDVPEGARDRNVQPIDSIVGILDGDGYEIMYEYGPYTRIGGFEEEQDLVTRDRTIDGRTGVETSYRAADGPWTVVRLLQLRDGADVLSVQVSCLDQNICEFAGEVFDSVRFSDR